MISIKKAAKVSLHTLLVLGMASPAFAKSDRLSIEMKGSLDLRSKDGDEGYKTDLRAKDVEVKLTAKLAKNVRAVLKANFDRQLITDGEEVSSEFDLEKAIKDAYIEIREVLGQPVAFVIGKQIQPYGAKLSNLPLRQDGPLDKLSNEHSMIGFTVKIDKNFFDLVDSIEASVFETEKYDLKIGSVDGAALRLGKQITENVRANVSYIHKGNGHDEDMGSDDRIGIGVVYDDGVYTAFVEGHGLINSTDYPDAKFATSAGIARELGPGEVAVEASYVHNSLMQLGLGYNLRVTENLTIGPEVRYTIYDENFSDSKDGVSVGVRATVKYGNTDPNKKTLLK